jgi:hypothetical protein
VDFKPIFACECELDFQIMLLRPIRRAGNGAYVTWLPVSMNRIRVLSRSVRLQSQHQCIFSYSLQLAKGLDA